MQLKSPLGMRFEGLPGKPGDHRVYTVGDILALDGYRPLADGALRFDITVLAVESATDAERQGGRADRATCVSARRRRRQGVEVVEDSDDDDQGSPSATRR